MRLGGIVLVLLALVAPAATAAEPPPPPDEPFPTTSPLQGAPVTVGMGEATLSIYEDPRFAATRIRNVRTVMPYDVVRTGGRALAHADAWLRGARARGFEPLVSFGYSARRRLRWHLPTRREYAKHLRAFRKRYPWVRELTTWNEANHKRVQPTGRDARRTASLYRELRRQCAGGRCRAVAVDILLTSSRRTWRWIRTFRRHAGGGRHTWGVHNYPDANRFSSRLTRRFLRSVRGEVWFTETGGIVRFGRNWARDERRAERAMRHVFRLTELSPRIKRVYLYNWTTHFPNQRWDTGFIGPGGKPRRLYLALLDELELDRFRPLPPEPDPLPALP